MAFPGFNPTDVFSAMASLADVIHFLDDHGIVHLSSTDACDLDCAQGFMRTIGGIITAGEVAYAACWLNPPFLGGFASCWAAAQAAQAAAVLVAFRDVADCAAGCHASTSSGSSSTSNSLPSGAWSFQVDPRCYSVCISRGFSAGLCTKTCRRAIPYET